MTSLTRLPADFTSLYRLFLRATAASVLNKAYATQRLRRLWRPSFDSAARVIHCLQDTSLGESERATLQRWYGVWEARTDKTLTVLSISARSRGLPHRVTRNLTRLASSYDLTDADRPVDEQPPPVWKPHLPPSSWEYAPRSLRAPGQRQPERKKTTDRDLRRKVNEEVWSALGEVMMMAEGRDGLTLGRIVPKRTRSSATVSDHQSA